MNNVILVIIFFKVSTINLVRGDNSRANLCLKVYSFLHFSLDGNWWLAYSKTRMHVIESLFGRLGDQNKGYINFKQ